MHDTFSYIGTVTVCFNYMHGLFNKDSTNCSLSEVHGDSRVISHWEMNSYLKKARLQVINHVILKLWVLQEAKQKLWSFQDMG